MDPITLLLRAVDQTGRIVASVTPAQLDLPTPCADWDLRALLNHTITFVDMLDGAAHTKPFDPSGFGVDNVGDDPGASYEAKAAPLRSTLANPGVIDATWTMPFGEVPGIIGAGFATLEWSQHGWDVARASGQDFEFDPEVTEAAFATARLAPSEQVRVNGVFGPEAGCADDAPLHDQLAAFLGRPV